MNTSQRFPSDDQSAIPSTRVRRLPDKAHDDIEALHAILDSGKVAHVGIMQGSYPVVIPVAYARLGNRVLIHGSSASRLFKCLDAGDPMCLTVTLLDGLVLARSLFESSMHYRSAMIFGVAQRVQGEAEIAGLKAISDHLMPHRWSDARHPSDQELKATITLEIPIENWSVKVSDQPPDDVPSDLTTPHGKEVWAGVIPIVEQYLHPISDSFVPPRTVIPDYIRGWSENWADSRSQE